jgi:Protein of unknown function (DUF3551)
MTCAEPDHSGDSTVKILMMIGILATAVAIDTRTGSAEAAPWCAWYDAYTSDCGYFTHQQCLDTIRGVGGWCSLNVYEYGAPYEPQPRRSKHARRHDGY